MPLGSPVSETGWLREADGFLILQREEGGRWRLDVHARARHLIGQRVHVRGTRADFDLLDVTTIEAI